MTQRIRSYCSYANVMASIAVFIALGGSAVAISKINGAQIKNHSIASKKFKRGATIANAELAQRTSQLLLSGSSPGTKAAGGVQRADEAIADNVVRLAAGDTATVLEKDPFSITASCIDKGNGAVKLEVHANTTEAGAWEADNTIHGNGTPLEPGQPVEFFNDAPNGHAAPALLPGVGRVAMVAPSGRSLDIGAINAGYHLFGADCSVTMFGIS